MKCLLLAFLLVACKPKEVPYQPPPKDDAAVAIDAAPEIDAAVGTPQGEATKIVVGDDASCALLADATVRCWGKNSDGQLGNGTTTDAPAPVQPALRGVKDIVMGTAHVCALLDDESVTCWGKINYGPKGNLLAPAAAPGVAKAKRIFAVGAASCATLTDASLVCWGEVGARGHLRRATGATRAPTPAAGLERVVAITGNGALRDDGTVWLWGDTGTPVRTTLKDVVEIASSGSELCGLGRDGSVACAGSSTRCASEVLPLPPAKHLALDVGLCVVTKTGKLQCLASGDGCRADPAWPGLANVDYATGSCARLRDGTARCWPGDARGRGVHAIAGVRDALAIAASVTHACAIRGDRSVVCWKAGVREASAVTL